MNIEKGEEKKSIYLEEEVDQTHILTEAREDASNGGLVEEGNHCSRELCNEIIVELLGDFGTPDGQT